LRAVELLRSIYESGGRKWPSSLPTSFLRPVWREAVLGADGADRRIWEAATLLALRDRATEAQQYRASGLAIVTAAIALWNTVYLGRALDDLRLGAEIIPDPLLAHLAPVGWQHINLTGDYLWNADTQLAPDGYRQLRAPAAITAHAA
jgi:hypothetical protein